MRIVCIQRIGQQCTVRDTEEGRSWRDRKRLISQREHGQSARDKRLWGKVPQLAQRFASMPKPAGFRKVSKRQLTQVDHASCKYSKLWRPAWL